MSYGLKYTTNFDSLQGITYTFNIYEKDYLGSDSRILLGGQPCVQQWQADDVFAPIQGCVLNVEIVNEGALPLSSFFSNNDDQFKGELVGDYGVHFLGFLVQDDSTEIQVDYAHYIRLSFTDNLGLLKDVPINQANFTYGTPTTVSRTVSYVTGGYAFAVSGTPLGLQIGQQFTLSGLSGPNGIYTVAGLTYFSTSFKIETVEYNGGTFSSGSATIGYTIPYFDLTDKLSLAEIFSICLNATGLKLGINVYSQLDVRLGVVGRLFEDVFLDGENFLNADKWDSCYTVMERILKRYRMVLLQTKGDWNFIRWDELRQAGNSITYFEYNYDFVYQSTVSGQNNVFNWDAGEIVTGLLRGILRPYKFVRQTFNYNQQENLLKNYNFQQLGVLLSTYTSGSNTVYEYDLSLWFNGIAAPNAQRIIRVIYDSSGNEIERYAVITGNTGDSSRAATSTPIEVNVGDKFKWSFSFRTDVSQPGNVNCVFSVRLFDGTTTRYLKNDGGWEAANGFTFTVLSGDNTNEWHSVEIEARELPYTGLLYIYLGEQTSSVADETWYKDLSFEYIPAVASQTKIIGHTHTNTQSLISRNANDFEIYVDDSPRNSIAGTQFLDSFTSLVQDRTSEWLPDEIKLGQITTFQELFWRRKTRTILEGTVIGILQSSRIVNKLTIFNSSIYPTLNVIFGQLSINYKNDLADFSGVEMWEDGEINADLESVYEFKYLYGKI
jgi:hypothetical protein